MRNNTTSKSESEFEVALARRLHSNHLAMMRNRKHRAKIRLEGRPPKTLECIDCGKTIIRIYRSGRIRCQDCSKIHTKKLDKEQYLNRTDKQREVERLQRKQKYNNLTPEQKEQNNIKHHIWYKKNPEKTRATTNKHKQTLLYINSQISFLERFFEKNYPNNPDIIFKSDRDRSKYQELTRFLFSSLLPLSCEVCDSKQSAHIHHKEYTYPIQRENLQRLCKRCHYKSHHPECNSVSKKEKTKLRFKHNYMLKHIKHCQLCGDDGTTERGVLEVHHFKYDDNPESYIKVCRICHHRKLHHNEISRDSLAEA